jgi:hypothetical protein
LIKEIVFKNKIVFLSLILFYNLSNLISYLLFFKKNYYLPNPFVGDKSDTFMDFFNPLYWGYQADLYTNWHSIYPPLNFLILKLIHCVVSGKVIYNNALDFRTYAITDIWVLILLYFLSIGFLLRHKAWSIFSCKEKTILYFIIITSVPMLYALERGNLIIISLFILPFVFSNNAVIKALSIAIIANIKPYFFLFLIYFVVKKEWKNLTISIMSMFFIFILSSAALGININDFFQSAFFFATNQVFDLREFLTFPSSINIGFPLIRYEQLAKYKLLLILLRCFLILGNLIIFFLLIKTIFIKSHEISSQNFFILFLLLISNIFSSAGGYSIVYYATFIPLLLKLQFRVYYILIATLLFVDLDFFAMLSRTNLNSFSFLSQKFVNVHWQLMSGSILRPILNFIFLYLYVFDLKTKKYA